MSEVILCSLYGRILSAPPHFFECKRKERIMGKKPKKNEKSRGFDFYFNKLALVIFTLMAILFVITAISTKMLPPTIIIPGIIIVLLVVVGIWVLSHNRSKSALRALGSVLAMLLCLCFAAGIRYIQVTMNTINDITAEEDETSLMTVYVRSDDDRNMEDLLDETFGTLATDQANAEAAIQQLDQKYNAVLTTKTYSSPAELVDALNDEKVDAILVNQGQLGVLEDLEGYEDTLNKLRKVESFHVVVQTDNDKTSISHEDAVFSVYISGSDSRDSNIMATGRSDVNIIATVNTETRQVLLLNTPRDFYIPLARSSSYDYPDKLTHAGLYGVDESKDTLAQYYGIDIDYYFRVNFSGFEEIIDALGGIEVDSEHDFYSTIAPTTIHYTQGINKLDGYEALYYVRERYAFVNGDYQRGINQMQVIQAVMKKAMSPTILTSYTSMMQAMSDCFRTSIPTDLISSVVRDQLANPTQDWNIVTYYVSGTGSSEYTYSIPSQKAYVTIPDESTVEMAKDLMQQVRDGQIIEDPNAEASDAPSY